MRIAWAQLDHATALLFHLRAPPEHRHVLRFSYRRFPNGEVHSDFRRDNAAGLTFAARATSSYPGAFPPAQIREIDRLIAAFDPGLVVVGGGVSAAGDRLLEPARTALSRSLVGAAYRRVPEVVRAELGPEAGAVGAAELVRRRQALR